MTIKRSLLVGAALVVSLTACTNVPTVQPRGLQNAVPSAPAGATPTSTYAMPAPAPVLPAMKAADGSDLPVYVPAYKPEKPVSDTLAAPLRPGSSGDKVSELQVRLMYVKCFPYVDATGTYGDATSTAVVMYQQRNGLPATGVVDQRTWDMLINASPAPTPQQKANQEPGKTYVQHNLPGLVKDLQFRLSKLGLWPGPIDGIFSPGLGEAVKTFQKQEGIPVTGDADVRTWEHLSAKTPAPTTAQIGAKPQPVREMKTDPRCLQGARVICVSVSERTATYFENGKAMTSFDGRPGIPGYETPRGAWQIHFKNWQTISTMFGERFPMPYAMFFKDSAAFHFSFDFANEGFNGGSHGCVNMRDYETMMWLYERVQVGDPVYIYD